ncbi:superinfection immunity protein [Sphaerimonospora thailandensis]|uniref:Superinfection immunity protein n=1 Tax=Sphaerimonospora thailandensis TaxID=795644 RepID=A0A8J3VWZ3_9ACTN|nr:superinfection immunity protein [Sphaerimonospora thailandensis]GIH68374.1 hypothetical protein Mth01_06270 [Sphaerimonospora thailandensis]
MDALANSIVFWIGLMLLLVVVFLLPSIIGVLRGVENFALLFSLNCLGGLTCIGWPAALIAAFLLPRRQDR